MALLTHICILAPLFSQSDDCLIERSDGLNSFQVPANGSCFSATHSSLFVGYRRASWTVSAPLLIRPTACAIYDEQYPLSDISRHPSHMSEIIYHFCYPRAIAELRSVLCRRS